MIYLASPWSHPERSCRLRRYEDALAATVALFRAGHDVFSPIVYSHPLHEAGLGGCWDTWQRFDRRMIAACSMVWVLAMDGWKESKGVNAEIDLAAEMGKPVRVLTLAEALAGGG